MFCEDILLSILHDPTFGVHVNKAICHKDIRLTTCIWMICWWASWPSSSSFATLANTVRILNKRERAFWPLHTYTPVEFVENNSFGILSVLCNKHQFHIFQYHHGCPGDHIPPLQGHLVEHSQLHHMSINHPPTCSIHVFKKPQKDLQLTTTTPLNGSVCWWACMLAIIFKFQQNYHISRIVSKGTKVKNKCVKNSSPLSISGTCGVQNLLLDCSRLLSNFSTVLTFSWIQSHVLFCAWFLCRLLKIEKKFLLLLSFSPAFCLLVFFWVFAIERILPVNMHNQQFCIAGLDYKVSTWSCRWLIKWSLYVGGAGYEFYNDFDLCKPAECSFFTGVTIKCESLAGGVHMDSLLDHCKIFITNSAKVWFSIFTPNCQVASLGWPSQIVYTGKNILVGFSCMFWNQQHLHA